MKYYHKSYLVPIYDRRITIGICDQEDISELATVLGRGNPEYKTWIGGVLPPTVPDSKRMGRLLLVGKQASPGDIAHEANHLMHDIMLDIYHPADRVNHEPDCYLLGWIVDRYYECKIKFDKK